MDENENTTVETPALLPETPAVETKVETPVVETKIETPAPVVVPAGYVKAEDVEVERTARSAAEAARTEAETRAASAEARARATEIKLAAQKLGFNDPSDAEKFITADVADIEAHLATVLESKSYLGKAVTPVITPTSPTNPARSGSLAPTFTQAQIGDRAFWNANKESIMAAMREGRISA